MHNYWICRKEPISIKHLDTQDKMQAIFDHFDTGIEVLSSELDLVTFCPVFEIRLNIVITKIRVTSVFLNDIIETLENYNGYWNNKPCLIFIEKTSIFKGFLNCFTHFPILRK
jgi:hypothetical protein